MKNFRYILEKQFISKRMKQGVDFLRLCECWPELVGDVLAEHLVPVRQDKDVLFYTSSHPGFAQELGFLENQVVAKIQHSFPKLNILRLKCTTYSPLRSDGEKLRLYQEKEQKRKEKYFFDRKSYVSPNICSKINKSVENISDEKMREKVSLFLQAVENRKIQLKNKGWRLCGGCGNFIEPESQCLLCHKGNSSG